MKKIYLISIVFFVFSGCGFITSDINLFRSGNSSIHIPKERKERFESAKRLLGKNKEKILTEFGLNMKISRKTFLVFNRYILGYDSLHPLLEKNLIRKSGIDSYYKVDEVGYYKYDSGIPMVMPNEYMIQFYFIDNICVHVSG